MDFESGDYLINVDKLKARFFDDLMKMSPNGQVNCDFEEVFMRYVSVISAIQTYGQEMGE